MTINTHDLDAEQAFLKGGGQCGALMRATYWAAHPLGAASRWPSPLATLVAVSLGSSQPMFVAWGPERRLLYNDAYAAILGHRHPAALGARFDEVWSEIMADVGPILERAFAGEPTSIDAMGFTLLRDGRPEQAYFSFSYTPVRDASGAVAGMFCACDEITDRVVAERRLLDQRAAEAEVRTLQAHHAFLLELADGLRRHAEPQAIRREAVRLLAGFAGTHRCFYAELEDDGEHAVIADSHGPGLPSLDGSCRLAAFGAAHAAALRAGRLVQVGDVANDPARTAAERASCLALGIAAHVGVPLLRDGRWVAVLAVAEASPRDWSRVEIDAVAQTAERTWAALEQARAQQALHQSEQRYRAVVDTQSEMVCRFRVGGEILFANPAYAAGIGAPPEAIVGRDFWGFIPRAEHVHVRAMLDRLVPDAPTVQIENHFGMGRTARWVLWTNRALRFDKFGRAVEAQSTGIDITDRRRAEQALREADARKDEFIAMLAHELRNPLAPLTNAHALLRRRGSPDDEQDRLLGMAERQTAQLTRLVDDLLEAHRVARGTIELRIERMRLDLALRQAVETAGPDCVLRRHTLTVDLASEALWIDADPMRVVQMLGNLLSNACKFTPDGGRIHVALRADGEDAVEVSVVDDGEGIAAEDLPTLFQLFHQADATLDRSRGGLGIGLALVRKLATLHGGSVRAESEGRGRGATFVLRLPVGTARDGAASVRVGPPGVEPGTNGL